MRSNTSKNITFLILTIVLVCFLIIGSVFFYNEPTRKFEETRIMMDTFVTVTVYYNDENVATEAIDAAFERIEEIVVVASRFNSSAEVYRLNANGFVENPSPELVDMMEICSRFYNITDGAYDVSILPLLDLWSEDKYLFSLDVAFAEELDIGIFSSNLRENFTSFTPSIYNLTDEPIITDVDDIQDSGYSGWSINSNWQQYNLTNETNEIKVYTKLWYLPIESQKVFINETLPYVGFDEITIDKDAIRLETGMSITLDGIAKGYAVDEGLEVLEELGFEHALINAGGDIATIGSKPDAPWTIALENPENREEYITRFKITGESVATSGNYLRYFDENQNVGHIINPETGFSANECWSATIITNNCTYADALATGVFVLGPQNGMQLIESLDNIEGLIIDSESEIHRSSGLNEFELLME